MTTRDDPTWRDRLRALGDATTSPLDALLDLLDRSLDDLPGSIGGYAIGRTLGRGGMGSTYEARDADGRRVALKIVPITTDLRRERVRREADVLMRLRHPGIVDAVGWGEHGGRLAWIAMELVEGPTLAQAVLSGTSLDAVGVVARCARALGAAHRLGIVHRDLKPENVILHPERGAVVVDFGLSRDLFEACSITRSGDVLGSDLWMSPEQHDGDPASSTPRSDVFALGLLLDFLLHGRPLRDRPGADARDFADPDRLARRFAPNIPAPIRSILFRCLSADATRRFADGDALADALERVAAGASVPWWGPTWRSRLRKHRRTAAVALFALGAAAGLNVGMTPPKPPPLIDVDALNDGSVCTLTRHDDGAVFRLPIPVRDFEATPGTWTVDYTANRSCKFPSLSRTFTVGPDGTRVRVNLLTASTKEGDTGLRRRAVPGPDDAWLHVRPLTPSAEVTIDGRRIDPSEGWIGVAAGRRRIEARTPDGLREVQDVVLRPREAAAVALLPASLTLDPRDDVKTLAWSESPIPEGVTVSVSPGAASILDGGRPPFWATGYLSFGASWAPLSVGVSSEVVITTRFDGPRDDIRALIQGSAAPGAGSLRLRARFDDEPWFDVPTPGRPQAALVRLSPLRATATGRRSAATTVHISATMTLAQADAFDPLVRFGASFADPPPATPERPVPSAPAFAIAGRAR